MITVQKMRDDLDYWIHIGIGDDIIFAPKARAEYQHLVKPLREQKIAEEAIPAIVLEALDREMKLPWYRRPTFWRIIRITILKAFRR